MHKLGVEGMRKILVMISIILLIFVNVNLMLGNVESSNFPLLISPEVQENQIEANNDLKYDNSRNFLSSRSSNAQGGEWLDSFKDTFLLDWGLSDNLYMANNLRIDIRPKVDGNTVALWNLNENSGTSAYDSTTNNHDGSLNNGVLWLPGIFGSGLSFDGTNDYVLIPDSDDFSINTAGDLSAEFWIKTGSSITSRQEILGKAGQSTSGPYEWSVMIRDQKLWGLYGRSTGNTIRAENAPVETNTLYHVVVCFTGYTSSDDIKIYLNSKEKSSVEVSVSGTYSNTNGDLALGRKYANSAWRFLNGTLDEVKMSNIERRPSKVTANSTSIQINKPNNMLWDTLIINKSQPQISYLNISIWNATNNQLIPGSPTYINEGEFDISYIDSKKYPFIKLNGSFKGNMFGITPTLKYWGVSWNSSNSWSDTFFGGRKVSIYNLVTPVDGNAKIKNTGYITSKAINIPDEHYLDTLIINKTEPVGGSLKVTILDASSNNAIQGFVDLTGSQIDLSAFDTIAHPSIKLRATYTSSGAQGTLHDWSVNWTKNTAPEIKDIAHPSQIKRTDTAIIAINLTDREDLEDDLTIDVQYKSPTDSNWKTDYLSNPSYNDNRWEYQFTPPIDAKVGQYQFSIVCSDSFQYMDSIMDPNFIYVLNNMPELLDITPSGLTVNRTKTLSLTIDSTDVERTEPYLNLDITYKSPNDLIWKSVYIDNTNFISDHWECTFTPDKNADLGTYILNVTCNDTENEVYHEILIEVINNKATQPTVEILPFNPRTTDDLTVVVSGATDIETRVNQINYWYRWYKDSVYLSMFDNLTSIPHITTVKDEVWHCIVYPFDGDEPGDPGEISIR
jgi:hypothetical protein